MTSPQANYWTSPEKALEYLRKADSIPHRVEGESTLLEFVPPTAKRVLDLGSGAGRLLGLVGSLLPGAEFVALDFSPAMIEHFHAAFPNQERIRLVTHDMQNPLPPLGKFDVAVSSFAIHHLTHDRKRGVYTEVFEVLAPGGVFCNLEHVSSPSERLHLEFLEKLGLRPDQEDTENKLLDLDTQLEWLRENRVHRSGLPLEVAGAGSVGRSEGIVSSGVPYLARLSNDTRSCNSEASTN